MVRARTPNHKEAASDTDNHTACCVRLDIVRCPLLLRSSILNHCHCSALAYAFRIMDMPINLSIQPNQCLIHGKQICYLKTPANYKGWLLSLQVLIQPAVEGEHGCLEARHIPAAQQRFRLITLLCWQPHARLSSIITHGLQHLAWLHACICTAHPLHSPPPTCCLSSLPGPSLDPPLPNPPTCQRRMRGRPARAARSRTVQCPPAAPGRWPPGWTQ